MQKRRKQAKRNDRKGKELALTLNLVLVLGLLFGTARVTVYGDEPVPHDAGIHAHDGIEFQPWTETDSLPEISGYYYLTENITLTEEPWEERKKIENVELHLCLNGKTIDIGSNVWNTRHNEVNIYDCRSGGKITSQNNINVSGASNPGTVCLSGSSSVLRLYGGRIENSVERAIQNYATCYIYGGEVYGASVGISSEKDLYLSGTPSISGGDCGIQITRNGGVVANDGTANPVYYSGPPIIFDVAQDPDADGYAVRGLKDEEQAERFQPVISIYKIYDETEGALRTGKYEFLTQPDSEHGYTVAVSGRPGEAAPVYQWCEARVITRRLGEADIPDTILNMMPAARYDSAVGGWIGGASLGPWLIVQVDMEQGEFFSAHLGGTDIIGVVLADIVNNRFCEMTDAGNGVWQSGSVEAAGTYILMTMGDGDIDDLITSEITISKAQAGDAIVGQSGTELTEFNHKAVLCQVTFPNGYILNSSPIFFSNAVTFHANGGANPPAALYGNAGESRIIPEAGQLSRTGYSFIGWNTQADGGGQDYKAGDQWQFGDDLELYALWEALTEIPDVSITGIEPPEADKILDVTADCTTTGVERISEIRWTPDDDKAGYNTAYTARVTVTPQQGYTFTSATTASVNGKQATIRQNDDGTATISYAFFVTESKSEDSTTTEDGAATDDSTTADESTEAQAPDTDDSNGKGTTGNLSDSSQEKNNSVPETGDVSALEFCLLLVALCEAGVLYSAWRRKK